MDAPSLEHGYSLAIPDRPWSPWLRLAHICRTSRENSGPSSVCRVSTDFQFFLQVEGDSWIRLLSREGPLHITLPCGHAALIPPGLPNAWGPTVGAHLAVHFDLHADPAIQGMGMLRLWPGAPQLSGGTPMPPPLMRLLAGGREVLRWPFALAIPDPAAWQRRLEPLLVAHARREHLRPDVQLRSAGILAALVSDFAAIAAPAPQDPVEEVLAAALVEEPSHLPTIAGLAARAGLGETAFRAAVRRRTGLAPHAWLEQRRMERAETLLAVQGLRVAEAARQVGYDDPFHFSRVFRRVTGRTPSEVRLRPGIG